MPQHDYTVIDNYVDIIEEKRTTKQQKILSGFFVIICQGVVQKNLVQIDSINRNVMLYNKWGFMAQSRHQETTFILFFYYRDANSNTLESMW